jgi:hypothetical protein
VALTRNAKRYVRGQRSDDFSALDWHFVASGLLGDLQDIRRREYTVPIDDDALQLYMRPVRLRSHRTEWRTWSNFTRVVEAFQNQWGDRRNKAITLRSVLREGPEAVRRFLVAAGESLPVLDASKTSLQETGWFGNACGYFDAIEALDFYVPL